MNERTRDILEEYGLKVRDDVYDAEKDVLTKLVSDILSVCHKSPRSLVIAATYIANQTVRRHEELAPAEDRDEV